MLREAAVRFNRFVAAVAAAGIASTLALGSASAMTTGATWDEDGDYPAVVSMVAVSADRQWAFQWCSGMFITRTVVLTASHCTAPTEEAWFTNRGWTVGVTNATRLDVQPDGWFPWTGTGDQAIVAVTHTNPLYRKGYREDVSMLELAAPFPGITDEDLPTLPPIGRLDALQKAKGLRSTPSLVLGYGSEQQVIPAPGGQYFPDSNERRYAYLDTTTIDKQTIRQSQRVTAGDGGACYGDSGGPTLMELDGTTYIVGVTSTGDMPCFATNTAGRVDTATARAFIDSVVG